jgi:hypothetical protein
MGTTVIILLEDGFRDEEVLEGNLESTGAVIIPGGYAPDRMRINVIA